MSLYDLSLSLIKRYEGLRLTAYPDPASGGDPWTVGYGATGPAIRQGTVWTLDVAEADLLARVTTLSEQVEELLEYPLAGPIAEFNGVFQGKDHIDDKS